MKSSKRFNSILYISFAIETSIEAHCVCVISVVHCGIFWKTHSSWPTTTRTTFNCWIHLKLWTCCGQTHDKHRESPFHSLPTPCWTQFSGWLSFICCHRVHTSIVSSSSIFGVAFRLPTLCEMGLIAGIWCKKNGLILCACSRTRTGTSSRTMLSLTGQDIPLQVISRICYARVAACDNNYNCNYINCNITEWANESTCKREGERWPCYILSDRLRDSEMCGLQCQLQQQQQQRRLKLTRQFGIFMAVAHDKLNFMQRLRTLPPF